MTSKSFIFLIHPFGIAEVDAALKTLRQEAKRLLPGLELKSAQHEVQAFTISENIRDLVCNCRFAIADLTGINPNVMMEIGLVMAIGKPVLIIWSADDGQKLPVNIVDVLYCKYDILRGKADKMAIEFSEELSKHLNMAAVKADKFRAEHKLPE